MLIKEQKIVSIVGPELQKKLGEFRVKLGVKKAGWPKIVDWTRYEENKWDIFPNINVNKCVVYHGDEKFSYSHHMTICKFKGHYVVSWSGGFRNEDYFGQEVHYSTSTNGTTWEPYKVLAHTDFDEMETTGTVRNNAGLCVAGGKLYAYVGVCISTGNVGMELNHMVSKHMWLDVYVTEDLIHWKHHERIVNDIYLFEAPRRTLNGDHLCCGYDINDWDQGLVLRWEKGTNLSEKPTIIKMPKSATGVIPEQSTWYQNDEGKIWIYMRDSSVSMRLALSWSEDGGKTWTEPLRTDFPNTYSRAYAGRLSDGRFYITGNNYDHFLDRSHLMIALSDNGEDFNQMYTLLNEPTTRRIDGYHKEDGYHYPNCMVDNGKLFVTISENKEDIVVVIIEEKDL